MSMLHQRGTRLTIGVRMRAVAVAVVILFFDLFEIYQSGALVSVAVPELGGGALGEMLVTAALFVGGVFGALAMGRVGDRYGRRRALLVATAIYGVGAVCTGLAPTLALLVCGRVVVGVGVGAVQPLTDAYVTDLFRPGVRGRALATVYTLAFFGVPAVGLLAYQAGHAQPLGVSGWRWLVLVGVLGALLVFGLQRWLIETPRWLRATGRAEQAAALADRLGGAGSDLTDRDLTDRDVVDSGAAPEVTRSGIAALFSPRWRRATHTLWLLNIFSPIAYFGFGTLAPLLLKSQGHTLLSSLSYSALSGVVNLSGA